jgi:hypothetical protein
MPPQHSGRQDTVRTFYRRYSGLAILVTTDPQCDYSNKVAARVGPQVSVGNVAERRNLPPVASNRQLRLESSNSEISTDARAGANAVPYTVAVYASWGICSITHQKKSVIGCSIPNRLSLEAF